MNHPALADDDEFRAELTEAALNKPSNSDVYTVAMARFVETFARVLGDPALPHLFFVEGGALAVENALKIAFDWKSRHNEKHGIDPSLGTRVLHLRAASRSSTGRASTLRSSNRDEPWMRWKPSRCGRPARRSRRTRTTSPASSPNRSRGKVATGTSGPSSSRRCASSATNTTPC
jgi:L-lysine 6-transaminase